MGKNAPSPTGNLQVIDLVRTFAILSVLAYHFYGTPPSGPVFQWFWSPFSGNGVYGVFVFFVVSGFLITRLMDGKKEELFHPRFRNFYGRRAARILPLLLVHVAIGAAIIHNVTHFEDLFWISIFTFSFNWYQAFHPNPVPGLYWGLLWSLSVEEQFYLFYPLFLRSLGKIRRLVWFLTFLIGFGVLWRSFYLWLPSQSSVFFYKTSFGAFDQIAIGILLFLSAKYWRAYLLVRKALSLTLCFLGALFLVLDYGWTNTNLQGNDIYSPTLAAAGAYFFILGGLHLPWFESGFWTPFTWPGKFSYGIYLFHPLLYSKIFYPFIYVPLLRTQDTFFAFLLFIVFVTSIMGCSFYFVERPINQTIRRLWGTEKV